MKTILRTIKCVVISICIGLLLIECDVTIDDVDDINYNSVHSIAYVKSLYENYPHVFIENCVMQGVVVANDRSGNIYKRLIVEDESGGIEIKIDKTEIYKEYFVGDSVMINCLGLTLGAYSGVLQLGTHPINGYETGYISEEEFTIYVHKTGGCAPMKRVTCLPSLCSFDSNYISCYVRFDNVQFADNQLGLNWTENNEATNRILVDSYGNELIVRTNPQAVFAEEKIPSGNGSICGVLSCFNNEYHLLVCDIFDVNMDGVRF